MPTLDAVTWIGLDTFMQELEVLTSGLVEEATAIMRESAEAARADIAAAYPIKSGNLRRGLVLEEARGTLLAGLALRQTAPHGYIFEHGTRDRENQAGQNRGRMTPRPTFEPRAYAYRRSAIADVIFRIKLRGAASVTGEAEE